MAYKNASRTIHRSFQFMVKYKTFFNEQQITFSKSDERWSYKSQENAQKISTLNQKYTFPGILLWCDKNQQPLWSTGMLIQSLAEHMGLRLQRCHSCSIGHKCSLDLMPGHSHASGAVKKEKKKKKEKTRKQKTNSHSTKLTFTKNQNSILAQKVKDLVLSLQGPRSLPGRGFVPWPGNLPHVMGMSKNTNK